MKKQYKIETKTMKTNKKQKNRIMFYRTAVVHYHFRYSLMRFKIPLNDRSLGLTANGHIFAYNKNNI